MTSNSAPAVQDTRVTFHIPLDLAEAACAAAVLASVAPEDLIADILTDALSGVMSDLKRAKL